MPELAEKAHDLAVTAISEVKRLEQKQDSHEDICGMRYKVITETMQEIKELQKDQDEKMDKHLNKIYGRAWTAIIAVLVVFVMVSGVMATYILTSADSRLNQVEIHNGAHP